MTVVKNKKILKTKMKKIADVISIIASILAIIVSLISLYGTHGAREKINRVQISLDKLTQETIYLAYYTKIIKPKNEQNFNQQYVPMEVTFGRDLSTSDHIWVIGFDYKNKYPLKKIEMAKGERTWTSHIELPHMSNWQLTIYEVNSENSKILDEKYKNKSYLGELSSSIFSFLGSVKVNYIDKGGN